MLVSLKEILHGIAETSCAVPGFNVFGYEDAAAVIQAAEELGAPVILMTNKNAIEHMPVEYLGNLLSRMAKDAAVPVCVHLDHAKDYALVERAINSGFSGVMYDGSQLSLEENIENTRQVIKLAHEAGVSVEAEIGSVGYSDPSIQAKAIYTDPEEARKFAEKTGVDALAVAVGTVHRMQIQAANIQYDRLEAIQRVVGIPLVIHGSTGVTDEDLAKLATYRVGKVNIGTALRMAFGNTLREEMAAHPNEFDRITLFKKPMEAVKEEAKNKLRILGFGKER